MMTFWIDIDPYRHYIYIAFKFDFKKDFSTDKFNNVNIFIFQLSSKFYMLRFIQFVLYIEFLTVLILFAAQNLKSLY